MLFREFLIGQFRITVIGVVQMMPLALGCAVHSVERSDKPTVWDQVLPNESMGFKTALDELCARRTLDEPWLMAKETELPCQDDIESLQRHESVLA